ncbi:ficolin-3-like [Mya arenaria]|uniref:ficolin-3-like n=1 Tax=Mya arenaria TaxID=6604 RepID=UPI0022E15A97|nr:ficolin-3-like [Mya arenaria]
MVVTDCLDVKRLYPSAPDGMYRVNLWKSKTAVSVYCDMTSSNGGWTVFQNRYDGSEEFYLNLKAYTEGFGKTSAEFWLGLRYIKELADQGNSTLRMEVSAADGSQAYEEWPDFSLGDAPGYKLHLGGNGIGTAGRGMSLSISQSPKMEVISQQREARAVTTTEVAGGTISVRILTSMDTTLRQGQSLGTTLEKEE